MNFQQRLRSEIWKELHQVQQKAEEFKGKLNQVVAELRPDVVHQDLTPKQRQQEQQLVKELKNRQAAGKLNLIIVNNRIVNRKPKVN
jgi:hypothetical protein